MDAKLLSSAMLVVLVVTSTYGDDTREVFHGEDTSLGRSLERVRDGCAEVERLPDYSCLLILRELVDGKLSDFQYLWLKVRHHPFSIYARWQKPHSLRGRELIYVEGRNDGKILAHEPGGFVPYVALSPTGVLAMRGHAYPYTQMDIKSTLLRFTKLLRKVRGDTGLRVSWIEGGKINGQSCTFLQLDSARQDATFSRVRIWFDDELQLPARFVKWKSSEQPDGAPELVEEYTFLRVEGNVGLTDIDFDVSNSDYMFQPFPRQQREVAQPPTGIPKRRRFGCFTRPRRP